VENEASVEKAGGEGGRNAQGQAEKLDVNFDARVTKRDTEKRNTLCENEKKKHPGPHRWGVKKRLEPLNGDPGGDGGRGGHTGKKAAQGRGEAERNGRCGAKKAGLKPYHTGKTPPKNDHGKRHKLNGLNEGERGKLNRSKNPS